MQAWLQLIRWQNLLIILLTQALVWWCLVLPLDPLVLHPLNFILLSVSTIMIAAAGYIINDYFDIKIDQINHPEKVVLGTVIPRKTAIIAHTLINIVAIAGAACVAVAAGHYHWLLLQLFCTGLLWFYSTVYKRRYMSGNIVVALLTALTVAAIYIYEPRMQQAAYATLLRHNVSGVISSLPVWILAVYAYFAFMLTWIREIVKDMEDMEGDAADGCVTMPIKRGLGYAARFASVLALLALLPLVLSGGVLLAYGYLLLGGYVLALLALPLALWIGFLWYGQAEPAHYHTASRMLKIIMLLGICALIIYKYQ
jgi:4-hydroxybenzoate polyprenyltransferase